MWGGRCGQARRRGSRLASGACSSKQNLPAFLFFESRADRMSRVEKGETTVTILIVGLMTLRDVPFTEEGARDVTG